jgi:BirA family transcriptional regulator, biotin operon repressor / biotin---[acetyl-CoA-carboxylase] ligase
MKSPISPVHPWLKMGVVASTQDAAAQSIAEQQPIGGVLARHQTGGRGRFGRKWVSEIDESLTMSLLFHEYTDHPRPYLVGMALAIAAAGALHCRLRWPNDLMIGNQKVGGILTEIRNGVPIVGVGINLNQSSFPEEIDLLATSLFLRDHRRRKPEEVAEAILARLELVPEPDRWEALGEAWSVFDDTPGKRYRLPTGEEAIAIGIGSGGELECMVNGESRIVLAAEALMPTAV